MKTVKAREGFDEPVTGIGLARAIELGRQRQGPRLRASTVQYVPAMRALLIGFADQSALALPVRNYPELAELSLVDLKHLAIGFGGGALCLEERDLHISIAGLVAASKPLMEMAATLIAVRNGSRSSAAKANASRENGLKGGRPRRLAAADR